MDGAGISALGPRVGLSGLPDPMGDATAQLEARRRQQIEGAGYDPDKGLYDRYSEMLGVLGPTIAERARAAADAMRRGDMETYQKIATDLSMDFGGFLGSIKGATGLTPLGGYSGAPEDAMLAVHNARADSLRSADKLGGLAVPSIGVVKPSQGFNSFGDISLVADPSLVTPGRGNPVYASDVYSPRFPSLNEAGDKIFRGFTNAGKRRYVPLTLENIVKDMKGNVRGGESHNYGAGSVRSRVTPQFKSMKEMQAARGRLVSHEQFQAMKDATNEELGRLAEAFEPYYKFSGRGWEHQNDFASMLAEPGGIRNLREAYDDLPAELIEQTRSFLARLRDMPTEYFEAKPQRAVGLGEFRGAVVPDNQVNNVADILRRNGIEQIETYPRHDSVARRDALMKFGKYFFSGAPVAGAGIGSLYLDGEEGGM